MKMNKLLDSLCIVLIFATKEENLCLATQYEYELQILKTIRSGQGPRPRCKRGQVPLEDFPDEVLRTQEDFSTQAVRRKLEICAEALQLDYCRRNRFKLSPNERPGRGKKYRIRVAVHNQGLMNKEIVVWAFRCPSHPPIFPRLNSVNQPVRVMVVRSHRSFFNWG